MINEVYHTELGACADPFCRDGQVTVSADAFDLYGDKYEAMTSEPCMCCDEGARLAWMLHEQALELRKKWEAAMEDQRRFYSATYEACDRMQLFIDELSEVKF